MAKGGAKSTPATAAASQAGIPFTLHSYDGRSGGAATLGENVAQAIGAEPQQVFKTLITRVDGVLTAAVVPVDAQLDLKALAAAAGGKRAAMAEPADAERATGYVTGGISPLGQRKRLPTVVDDSAHRYPTVYCSAGRRGLQLELAPSDLIRTCDARTASIAARC